jgi:hypothetical protein
MIISTDTQQMYNLKAFYSKSNPRSGLIPYKIRCAMPGGVIIVVLNCSICPAYAGC